MQEIYLDSSADIEWLLDVHCRALSAARVAEIRRYPRAAVLYGNEDCPDAVDIYETASPLAGDAPILRMKQDADGNLAVTPN